MRIRAAFKLALAVASMSLVAACTAPSSSDKKPAQLENLFAGPSVDDGFPKEADQFRAKFAGHTAFFGESSHGTQIEYFAPNGRAYLWYPGNRQAVPSNWKVVPAKRNGRINICFQYPSASYNPVTKKFGGTWECRPTAFFTLSLKAIVKGDPFNLETGKIPTVVPRGKSLSIEQVLNLTPANENLSYTYKK